MTTVTLRGFFRDQEAQPLVGAVVNIDLDRTDIDQSYIAPSHYCIKTDEDGRFEVDLWPNALGVTESRYKIKVVDRKGRTVLNTFFTLPDTVPEVDLKDVAIIPPFPGKSDFEVALETVQEQVVIAVDAAERAEAVAEAIIYGYEYPIGFSKDLIYDAQDTLIQVVLSDGQITINKNLVYNQDGDLIEVNLTGDVPSGVSTIKTLTYANGNLINVTYS
jgi:hypothetical protein